MVPIRPSAKELCVISLKSTDTAKTADDTKKAKKPSKKKLDSSGVKQKEKDLPSTSAKGMQPKPKLDKLKTRANSISGEITKLSTKSPETSNAKKSLKTKLQAAVKSIENQSLDKSNDVEKKMLKRRSVSVQSLSSVNNNTKRSRVTSSSDIKSSKVPKTHSNDVKSTESHLFQDSSKTLLKRRSVSVQSPSTSNKVPISLNKFAAKMKSRANFSPKNLRTRKDLSTVISSTTTNSSSTTSIIPQLDGGDDNKKKKEKPQLFKLKLPIRARSVSPTSTSNRPSRRSTSVAAEKSVGNNKNAKKTKPNLLRIRLPSVARSMSKSPASTSERVSRKTNLDKLRSKHQSPSPVKPAKKLKKDSKTSEVVSSPVTSEHSQKSMKDRPKLVRSMSKSPLPSASKAAAVKSNLQLTSPIKSTTVSKSSQALSPSTSKPKSSGTKVPSTTRSKSTVAPLKSNSTLTPPIKSLTRAEPVRKISFKAIDSKSPSTSKAAQTKVETKKSKATAKLTNPTVSASSSKQNEPSTTKEKSKKVAPKRPAITNASSDSDFASTPKKKLNSSSSATTEKPLPKAVEKLKKRIDRRVLSTDDESLEPPVKLDDMNYWIEVYSEADRKWICVDLFKLKVNCLDKLKVNLFHLIILFYVLQLSRKFQVFENSSISYKCHLLLYLPLVSPNMFVEIVCVIQKK